MADRYCLNLIAPDFIEYFIFKRVSKSGLQVIAGLQKPKRYKALLSQKVIKNSLYVKDYFQNTKFYLKLLH
jgi:hypothetical protein